MAPREWINPRTGESQALDISDHAVADVAAITARSHEAWLGYRDADNSGRAAVLNVVADALDYRVKELSELADEESALGIPRLTGEVARTTFQLRLFAESLDAGTLLPAEIGEAVPGDPPAGRPELVRHYVPLGPVAVFGSSNFPFAFGVLGGDTASALAAGCTVVAKEHSAHPRLSQLQVTIAREALSQAGHDPDLILSVTGTAAGATLVTSDEIAAVGFTGSVAGGRTLFDLATSRPKPIPFFGELGSVNPVIVSPAAAQSRAEEIAEGFVASLLLGAGQFCTKPSILVYPRDSEILSHVVRAISKVPAAALLTDKIAKSYRTQIEHIRESGAEEISQAASIDRPGAWVAPAIFQSSVGDVLSAENVVGEECFGPAAFMVPYDTESEALACAAEGEGALVGCVHGVEGETLATELLRALAHRSGRVVWNGWPTGVAVAPAQMHGGPYPASTVPQATSVGLHAASRFSRPVAFQSVPAAMRPVS